MIIGICRIRSIYGAIWGIIMIMEKRMETTVVYWSYIGTMEKMEATVGLRRASGLGLRIQGLGLTVWGYGDIGVCCVFFRASVFCKGLGLGFPLLRACWMLLSSPGARIIANIIVGLLQAPIKQTRTLILVHIQASTVPETLALNL